MKRIMNNLFKNGRFFNLFGGEKKVVAPKNSISEDRQEATIYMYDEISEWWGINVYDFSRTINEMMDIPVIHLRINCPGGEIFEAAAMQKIMAEHPATFLAHIDCLAASAMSFMIRGANKRIISDMGFIMIHRAMSGMYGNGDELQSWGEALKKMDNTICESYMKVTGKEKEEVMSWMEKETWFSAEEALEHGFVDEISEAEPENGTIENIFDLSVYDHAPDKFKNIIDKKEDVVNDDNDNDINIVIDSIDPKTFEHHAKANARKIQLALAGV